MQRGRRRGAVRLQPRRRHGRHGVHREQQGRLHALGAHQHAHADGRAQTPASSASSTPRRPASTPPTSRRRPTSSRSRGGRLPGHAGGRLRLGEALQRAHVPPLHARTSASTTRVARYHNVYGPHGTYDGGREKAPAAICRKVIRRQLSGTDEIEIWGDGEQTRSFMYIDDCVDGTLRLMASDVAEPINLGSERARHDQPARRHRRGHRRRDARAPLQARRSEGRPRPQQRQHADHRSGSGGTASIRLEDGMRQTYDWIHSQMTAPEGARTGLRLIGCVVVGPPVFAEEGPTERALPRTTSSNCIAQHQRDSRPTAMCDLAGAICLQPLPRGPRGLPPVRCPAVRSPARAPAGTSAHTPFGDPSVSPPVPPRTIDS